MKLMETDIHLHLDGSLSIPVIKLLADQTGYDFKGKDIRKSVSVGDNCESLEDYLKCFDLPGQLLQTEEALSLASADLVQQLAAQGLIYSEIRFAPQLHTKKGLTKEMAVEAVIKGMEKGLEQVRSSESDFSLKTGILLCAMVNGPDKENQETFELAAAYKGKGVAGVDIAGPEGFVPMEHFSSVFRKAYKNDVPFTIHAGECGDYENITRAVSYGARRIGHGCGAIRSEDCMSLLKKEKVTLEMCITSNLQTKAVSSIQEHPVKAFYDRGIRVTYNTDNMTVSDTTLEKEADILRERLGFTESDLRQMNRYALEAAFLEDGEKEKIIDFFDRNTYNGM